MLMPKTAVNKYDLASRRKYHIGGARKVATIQPVAIAQPMDVPSNHDLQSSVGACHGLHDPTAMFMAVPYHWSQ